MNMKMQMIQFVHHQNGSMYTQRLFQLKHFLRTFCNHEKRDWELHWYREVIWRGVLTFNFIWEVNECLCLVNQCFRLLFVCSNVFEAAIRALSCARSCRFSRASCIDSGTARHPRLKRNQSQIGEKPRFPEAQQADHSSASGRSWAGPPRPAS
jgi:hypothetical protein